MALVQIYRDGAVFEVEEETVAVGDLPSPNPTGTYRVAIQQIIDEAARSRSYDSGITCASYLGSTNPIWAAEAYAFISWRDAVWSYAYAEMAKVEAGTRAQPSVADLLAELPTIAWPA